MGCGSQASIMDCKENSQGQWLEQRDLQVPTIMKEEKFNIKEMYKKRGVEQVLLEKIHLQQFRQS